VSDAEHGSVNTGSIDLDLQKGERISLGVKFEDTFEGPLELTCLEQLAEEAS
jgi:hypothetical protein